MAAPHPKWIDHCASVAGIAAFAIVFLVLYWIFHLCAQLWGYETASALIAIPGFCMPLVLGPAHDRAMRWLLTRHCAVTYGHEMEADICAPRVHRCKRCDLVVFDR